MIKKKKILISAYNLDIGGIETSLINMLKNIDTNKFDITLLLQDKRGVFLHDVPSKINIKEYKTSSFKIPLIRKILNRLKIIIYIISNYKKYDLAIHYATYDIPSSIICKYVGKQKIFWIHSDYSKIYDVEEMREFFIKRKYEKYDKLVFVANELKQNFFEHLSFRGETKIINNLLDIRRIKDKAKEKMDFNVLKNKYIFIFVGRLEETSKKISLLLDAFKMHQTENKDSLLWIIGDGPDKNMYVNFIKNNNLSDCVTMFGKTDNPYKYINNADCLVLTSEYEGFPVVLLEALVLNKKIISTIEVTANDFKLGDYIVIVPKYVKKISEAMTKSLNNKPLKFDYQKENMENIKRINELLTGGLDEI